MGDFPIEKHHFLAREHPEKVASPSRKFRFIPKQLYMETRSFRDILTLLLEEKAPETTNRTTPPSAPSAAYSAPFLNWRAPDLNAARKSPYPSAKTMPLNKVSGPKAPRPVAREVLLPLHQLNTADQSDAQLMIVLGCSELKDGISLRALKRTHRRLVKTLHPDGQPVGLTLLEKEFRAEQFLSLQAAYERLSQALKGYQISESACDSESVSAPGYRRPNAA